MTQHDLPTPSPTTLPARLSDADRDRVIEVLREGAAQGRLSQDTFFRRMELAFEASGRDELDALTADLPQESRLSRIVFGTVARASSFTARVRRAWFLERLPKLLMPEPGPYPLRIGRDPANGLRLNDDTVSRVHAELSRDGALWVLCDLGSTNGTWVNSRRVTGRTVVRAGDQVTFGSIAFRLAAR
ncbi:FHA domain-containing protein [Streptomyces sp. NPDC048639]|uniref:FHA domain-containing protein n=1 Tax=Streptomyces sp. NPDC048639 TaxID=3365581 RepID=UPI003717DE14